MTFWAGFCIMIGLICLGASFTAGCRHIATAIMAAKSGLAGPGDLGIVREFQE